MRIKELPKSERPRERVLRYGVEALSNAELIAIILRTGSKDKNALELANVLLKHFDNNLKRLFSADISELRKIKGIGIAKAVQLKAVFELARRINTFSNNRIKINSPADVYRILHDKLANLDKEQVVLLCLDAKNRVIDNEVVLSIGSLEASIVDPKAIFKVAIARSSSSIILVHNHPSGDPTPSIGDINATKGLIEAGRLLNIPLQDHVIIGKNSYCSLKESIPELWKSNEDE